jgi:hypothetical protein
VGWAACRRSRAGSRTASLSLSMHWPSDKCESVLFHPARPPQLSRPGTSRKPSSTGASRPI